ncbi:MAG: zinc-dependent metalloprotease family protein, partial [Candidatus Heimdallarchaeaceae archaeon]
PMVYIRNASTYFEKDLGIKLIPILELIWKPATTEYPAVHDYAKQIAGEQMGLEGDWEFFYGRSLNNNGFDFLSCFSNQTSDHYGFAFLNSNMAYHFAQSRELENYLGFSFSMPDEWAENIVQHEISHDFGALDRDRAIYAPSVMSKPYTVEQALAQVNNWLLDDILLMLANREMFD